MYEYNGKYIKTYGRGPNAWDWVVFDNDSMKGPALGSGSVKGALSEADEAAKIFIDRLSAQEENNKTD